MIGRILLTTTLFLSLVSLTRAQYNWENQVIEVGFYNDLHTYRFIADPTLYEEGWYLLPQVRFWRMVINLDPQYSLLNIASTREVLSSLNTYAYDELTLDNRKFFKDSIRLTYSLPNRTRLWITQGRKDYYKIAKILPDIHEAIRIFLEENTDPWYAQSILLIESPGEMRVSPVGAKGPFQLMGEVALSVGLTVNDQIDERSYLAPSARGAAKYVNRICLPAARDIMRRHNISYQEDDLWFRLFVLHIYHAGATNMKRVMRHCNPDDGGMDLIQQLWQTNYRSFGNASQNYSQITLAALLELEQIVFDKQGFFIPSP